jgi:hypothetical protein
MNQPTANNPATTPARKPSSSTLFPEGFIAIRRGLADHLISGKMSAYMFSVYFVLLLQCDWSTGIWNGNAHRIYYALGGSMSLSEIRKNLAKLCRQLYVKSLHYQGRKGNYYVLINRYIPTVGEHEGKALNAIDSTSWKNPIYEVRSDDASEDASDSRVKTLVTRVSAGSETRPYQDIQDVQDFQDSQDSSGGGGGKEPPAPFEVQPLSGNEQPDLISEMREIWDYHNLSGWNTKPADIEQSISLSDQYGKRIFLQAFDSWCYHDATDQLATKYGDPLTFPLPKFLGQAAYYTKKTQDEYERKRRRKTGPMLGACPIVRESGAVCTENG